MHQRHPQAVPTSACRQGRFSTPLQNGPFCVSLRPVSFSNMAAFGMQNGPYRLTPATTVTMPKFTSHFSHSFTAIVYILEHPLLNDFTALEKCPRKGSHRSFPCKVTHKTCNGKQTVHEMSLLCSIPVPSCRHSIGGPLLCWCHHPVAHVRPFCVIEPDYVGYELSCLPDVLGALQPVKPFLLYDAVDPFRHRVVGWLVVLCHRDGCACGEQQLNVCVAAILRASVGVVYQPTEV